MAINEVIPFLKEHAYVYWREGVPESVFESLEAMSPDVLTQVCYLANGVYQPWLDLEVWLDGPGIEPAPLEGIEIYCAARGPTVYVPVTRERLRAVRTGLTNIRQDYGLSLCGVIGQGWESRVEGVNFLLARQLPEENELLDFLLSIGFQPSWRDWVLAQYQANPSYETFERPEDLPQWWFSPRTKVMVLQTNVASHDILGHVCNFPPSPWWSDGRTPETPITLAAFRQAQGGMIDEDALSWLGDLRRQHNMDLCGDLEIQGSGLLVVGEKMAGDYPADYLHSMLDFLLDLGYWPSWREWVAVQLSGDFPEQWDGLERKAMAARTNETIWETLEGLCRLVPQPEPTATTPVRPSPERIDAVRHELADVRQRHGLDLCEHLSGATGINAANLLWGYSGPFFESLLDIGFPPSWREWVLAQYEAAPDDSRVWPEDALERWFNYDQKAAVTQTVEGIWALLGFACAWPPGPQRTLDLTPATLEDAQRQLGDLRRQHGIDICGDLEMYGSGFLVVESKVIADYRPDAEDRAKVIRGHTDAAIHAMLDFLVDLGYRPSWREWVIGQLTASMFHEIKESYLEHYEETWSDTEGWGSLPSKALAAQTNEALWEDVRGLCGLTSTATQE